MKALQLITLSTYVAIIVNARLIEKNTEKTAETQPTESPSPVRVSRQALYEDDIGSSKEDVSQEEDLRTYVRKGRHSIKSKPTGTNVPKTSKDSSEDPSPKMQTEQVPTKSTKPLIKKPIPKFNDIDYEDFQGKVNRSPVKFSDSGENEDEDFNLDDYDFDVNHDEFVGRGKPLEPRTKTKLSKPTKVKKSPKVRSTMPPPEIKTQSKVVIPTESSKKKIMHKKIANKMKEDYYDDVITTTTTKGPDKRDPDDEFLEDAEESKELNGKSLTRVARSPWLVKYLSDRMGMTTATVMSNIIKALPALPQPHYFNIDDGAISDNSPVIDPLTNQVYVF